MPTVGGTVVTLTGVDFPPYTCATLAACGNDAVVLSLGAAAAKVTPLCAIPHPCAQCVMTPWFGATIRYSLPSEDRQFTRSLALRRARQPSHAQGTFLSTSLPFHN